MTHAVSQRIETEAIGLCVVFSPGKPPRDLAQVTVIAKPL
jgi:hypothetical protein